MHGKRNNPDRKPLGLYIHIPFCVKKCLYCDFLSFAGKEGMIDFYVDALCKEIEQKSTKVNDSHVVKSIFFGGGTPSLLATVQVEKIFSVISSKYVLDEDCEISIEVNPGTVSLSKLTGYRTCGINRISIGLQSADNDELKRLGRIHSFEEFLKTFSDARKAGFSNINVDLMSALPGQTMSSWENTLEKIVILHPEHISAYSLIIEENTPFYDMYGDKGNMGSFPLPEEDDERNMYMLTEELLKKYGYQRYEISNYAKPSFECRHNSSYWIRNDYLGFGIGAASLLDNRRWRNIEELDSYIDGMSNMNYLEPQDVTELSVKDQMEEFMYLGLRLCKGVSEQDFSIQFHKDMRIVYGTVIDKFIVEGLLEHWEYGENKGIRLTNKGVDVSNYVLAEFLLSE